MFAIALLLLVGQVLAQNCPGSTITDYDRKTIADLHNSYRSRLVKGEFQSQYGAPGGNNMHELTYDCDLEASAERWAKQCRYLTHSGYSGVGENLYHSSGKTASTNEELVSAMNMWWAELYDNGFKGAKYYSGYGGDKGTLGHWSQMAWAKTSKVGCAFVQCSGFNTVVCQYKAQGNMRDQNIYETGGNGCNSDGDCKSNKCNTQLALCKLGENEVVCQDKYSNCDSLKPYCNSAMNPHVAQGCPETCNTCGSGSGSSSSSSGSGSSSSGSGSGSGSSSGGSGSGQCYDLFTNCATVAAQGCNDHNPQIKYGCPVSCGTCGQTSPANGGGASCEDYYRQCSQITQVCSLPVGKNICSKTCGAC